MTEIPKPSSLRRAAAALVGNVSGVYFLFEGDELVYIGEGWNCFLRVAEHTRKESTKKFTHWSYLEIPSRSERKIVERTLRAQYSPRYNKV